MDRLRFTNAERIEMVEMDLKGKSVDEIGTRFNCSDHSVYQARRCAWYHLLHQALAPHIGDRSEATQIHQRTAPNNVSVAPA